MSSGFGMGAAPAVSEIDASTPWVAAGDGDLDLLQRALSLLALTIDCQDENGYTLLQAAASYSQMTVLQWLLAQKVDLHKVDAEGDTALHYASTVDAARLLVEAGIDHQRRNQAGKTALEAKQEELQEMMADEDEYDEDDQDAINLRALIGYLSGLGAMEQ